MKQNIDEQLIRKYLLGKLPEPEHLRVEEALFTDDQQYQQLLLAEEELIDEYVYDALPADEREGFESYFLSAPERHEDVRFSRALKKYVTTNAVPAASPEPLAESGPPSIWKRFLALFNFKRSPMQSFALVAAALLIIIGVSWLVVRTWQSQPRSSPLEAQKNEPSSTVPEQQNSSPARDEQTTQNTRRTDELQQPPVRTENSKTTPDASVATGNRNTAASTTPPSTTLAFFLKPGLVRDAGGINKVVLPAQARMAKMQLPLLTDAQYASYQVVLKNEDGQELLSRKGLRATRLKSEKVVEVVLPARVLQEGEYRLELSGNVVAGETEPLGKYYFRVSKQ